ncbi:PREDICTED: nuclear transcriptional regulator 1-like protein [Colobus angolensis palliatus]|uniref:nuclear transcriptional regulator 1-like protein n=1 Tax=Colobus angolensis palliatus TaxID=336983 RepID=UPI0005F4402E|nr:PREDICTED: nuclear transcriptional regulator 1-like protein [Colobus angolensis palliatus]
MTAAAERALPRLQALARQPPPISNEEELYDCLDYYYLRDFPASGAGRSKGRTRREQALRTNRPAPGGHERKVLQKLLNVYDVGAEGRGVPVTSCSSSDLQAAETPENGSPLPVCWLVAR